MAWLDTQPWIQQKQPVESDGFGTHGYMLYSNIGCASYPGTRPKLSLPGSIFQFQLAVINDFWKFRLNSLATQMEVSDFFLK